MVNRKFRHATPMILNLDKNFQPFGKGIDFNTFMFPSECEAHIKLPAEELEYMMEATITTRIKSSNDVMTLLLATDALKRAGITEIELFMPYLPYARQDRVMVPGEPFSLGVFANLINMQDYASVITYDVHSDVAPALLKNVACITNHVFVAAVLSGKKDYHIVSPDAGAYKKIFKLCQYLKSPKVGGSVNFTGDIILCNKIRDTGTGTIEAVAIDRDDLGGKDCYIIDDICDGGATFTHLAEELRRRNAGKINLVVSHGIFSKGLNKLQQHIDHIYTTNSFSDMMGEQVNRLDKFTQIKLTDGLLSGR